MREQVYVKFAEALQRRQLEKQAAALAATGNGSNIGAAELDQAISQLQEVKQAEVGAGAGPERLAELDAAIGELYIAKSAELSKEAKLRKLMKVVNRRKIRTGKEALKRMLGGERYRAHDLANANHLLTMRNLRQVIANSPGARALLEGPTASNFPALAQAGVPVDAFIRSAGKAGNLGKHGRPFAKQIAYAAKGGNGVTGSAAAANPKYELAHRLGLGEFRKPPTISVSPAPGAGGGAGGGADSASAAGAGGSGRLWKILAALGVGGAGATGAGLALSGGDTPAVTPKPKLTTKQIAAILAGGTLGAGTLAGGYALAGDDEDEDRG